MNSLVCFSVDHVVYFQIAKNSLQVVSISSLKNIRKGTPPISIRCNRQYAADPRGMTQIAQPINLKS